MRAPSTVSFAASIVLLTPFVLSPAAHAQNQLWLRQFGTSLDEETLAVASDGAEGVMIAGKVGSMASGFDATLARYDSGGNQLWTLEFGTLLNTEAWALATDGVGGAFVAGFTLDSLGGPFNAGGQDVFLARYDNAGNRIWIRQFGSTGDDLAFALAPDGTGGFFVGGCTEGGLGGPFGSTDVFLARYDSAGSHLWTRQFGTAVRDISLDLAPDGASGVYVAGNTDGDLGGPNAGESDAFLARYDNAGNQLWVRQLGTSEFDWAEALAPDDAGGVMIAGFTAGNLGGLNAGGLDAFVARYDEAGNQIWIRQFGSSSTDRANALAADGEGGVVIAGLTHGHLGGPNAGGGDVFLKRIDDAGNQVWLTQFGSIEFDGVRAMAPDANAGMMIGGFTRGDLGGASAGGETDAFLARFTIGPCYADCDQSTGFGVLDIFDFLCFQDSFVNRQPYACNCDTSTGVVCDIFDFLCFQDAFVGGCP